jgi:hypothetical protein
MLSSRFAGIPISPSIIDEAGLPQLLACGEQTLRAENSAQVAGFISEWWPASNRNGGRLQIGISRRIESEFAGLVENAKRRHAYVRTGGHLANPG